MRLDLTVNILTSDAIHKNKITIFGGEQKRPNIHIEDVTDLYVKTLTYPKEKIAGKIFNCGYENHRVSEIALIVKNALVGHNIHLETKDSDDKRSYSISSKKIKTELGFEPTHTIDDAVKDLDKAFAAGFIPDAVNDPRYYNIKTMKLISLV
jgi:nucleoside-diphosphate-sugar epimerase